MKTSISKLFTLKRLALALFALSVWFVLSHFWSLDRKLPEQDLWLPGLSTVDCWFDIPEGLVIECGEYQTDEIAGRFNLPFVIVRDQSEDRRSDPLVYLSGGPGNSTYIDKDNIDSWFYWLETAKLKRDLILLDQRGTGLSKPSYRCRAYDDYVRSALAKIVSREVEYREALNTVHACVREFERRGFNLSHYSSSHSARDMNSLMLALGIEQWNIVGTSYGTRLALDWLRLNERTTTENTVSQSNIRAVILDSIYPVDKGLLTEWPESIEKSFTYFFQACKNKVICDTSDKDIEEQFWPAANYLKENPAELSVPLWHGGWPVKTLVDDNRFISMIINSLYDQSAYPNIINAIKQINSRGNKSSAGESHTEDALQILAEGMVNSELAPEFNPLIYLAIDCGEILRVEKSAYEAERAKFPAWQRYTEFAWDYDFCSAFPVRSDIDAFREPVNSDTPILVLSGGFDPVTPSAWATDFARNKPKVNHWHLPNVGHGVSASSVCVHESLVNFLDDLNGVELPTCLAESLTQ